MPSNPATLTAADARRLMTNSMVDRLGDMSGRVPDMYRELCQFVVANITRNMPDTVSAEGFEDYHLAAAVAARILFDRHLNDRTAIVSKTPWRVIRDAIDAAKEHGPTDDDLTELWFERGSHQPVGNVGTGCPIPPRPRD